MTVLSAMMEKPVELVGGRARERGRERQGERENREIREKQRGGGGSQKINNKMTLELKNLVKKFLQSGPSKLPQGCNHTNL